MDPNWRNMHNGFSPCTPYSRHLPPVNVHPLSQSVHCPETNDPSHPSVAKQTIEANHDRTVDKDMHHIIWDAVPFEDEWATILSNPSPQNLIGHHGESITIEKINADKQGHLSKILKVILDDNRHHTRHVLAVKQFHPRHHDANYHQLEKNAYAERIKQETRCYSRIKNTSRYILPIFQTIGEPHLGIVMPYISHTLMEFLLYNRLENFSLAEKVLHDLAHGVADLSRHGIIHRNLTGSTVLVNLPENISLTSPSQLDFLIGSFEFALISEDLKKMRFEEGQKLLCCPPEAQPPELKRFMDPDFKLTMGNFQHALEPICTLVDSYQVGRCTLAALSGGANAFNTADYQLLHNQLEHLKTGKRQEDVIIDTVERLTKMRTTESIQDTYLRNYKPTDYTAFSRLHPRLSEKDRVSCMDILNHAVSQLPIRETAFPTNLGFSDFYSFYLEKSKWEVLQQAAELHERLSEDEESMFMSKGLWLSNSIEIGSLVERELNISDYKYWSLLYPFLNKCHEDNKTRIQLARHHTLVTKSLSQKTDFAEYIVPILQTHIGVTRGNKNPVEFPMMITPRLKTSLRDWIKEEHQHKKLPSISSILHVFGKLLAAVQFMHTQRVSHNSLYPGSFTLKTWENRNEAQARWVLSGFEYATSTSPNETMYAHLDPETFPLAFVAPEHDLPTVDGVKSKLANFKEDAYSLGLILIEMLCNFRPTREANGRNLSWLFAGQDALFRFPTDSPNGLLDVNQEMTDLLSNVQLCQEVWQRIYPRENWKSVFSYYMLVEQKTFKGVLVMVMSLVNPDSEKRCSVEQISALWSLLFEPYY